LEFCLHMKRSLGTFAVLLVGVVALSTLASGVPDSRACPALEAQWSAFNLLHAEQVLRVVSALMTLC